MKNFNTKTNILYFDAIMQTSNNSLLCLLIIIVTKHYYLTVYVNTITKQDMISNFKQAISQIRNITFKIFNLVMYI